MADFKNTPSEILERIFLYIFAPNSEAQTDNKIESPANLLSFYAVCREWRNIADNSLELQRKIVHKRLELINEYMEREKNNSSLIPLHQTKLLENISIHFSKRTSCQHDKNLYLLHALTTSNIARLDKKKLTNAISQSTNFPQITQSLQDTLEYLKKNYQHFWAKNRKQTAYVNLKGIVTFHLIPITECNFSNTDLTKNWRLSPVPLYFFMGHDYKRAKISPYDFWMQKILNKPVLAYFLTRREYLEKLFFDEVKNYCQTSDTDFPNKISECARWENFTDTQTFSNFYLCILYSNAIPVVTEHLSRWLLKKLPINKSFKEISIRILKMIAHLYFSLFSLAIPEIPNSFKDNDSFFYTAYQNIFLYQEMSFYVPQPIERLFFSWLFFDLICTETHNSLLHIALLITFSISTSKSLLKLENSGSILLKLLMGFIIEIALEGILNSKIETYKNISTSITNSMTKIGFWASSQNKQIIYEEESEEENEEEVALEKPPTNYRAQ